MKKVSFLLVIFLGMIHGRSFAQFEWSPGTAGPFDFVTRFNVTGIGFPTAAAAATAAGGRSFFVVDGTANAPNGNILAHWLGGQVGPFTSGNTWCGLGEGNPGGPVTPYGLAMAKGGSVGFYNLFPGSAGEDVIAGFGVATGTNANRFRIRSYDNASAFTTGDDILIANPPRHHKHQQRTAAVRPRPVYRPVRRRARRGYQRCVSLHFHSKQHHNHPGWPEL